MILKSHLCGIAVAFDRFEDDRENPDDDGSNTNPAGKFFNSTDGRPQGSLYSQQKRKIADACEYMRLNAVHKPLIFVATSPGFTDLANEKKLISKLTHNLRNGYACKNYVWVREFTERGFPHFHFVADMPDCDFVALSVYWSGLFGSDSRNSIRFGSYPGRGKRRTLFLKHRRHAWYLTKYLGKSVGQCEKGANANTRIRTFAVSQELSKLSAPKEYKSKMVRVNTGRMAYHVSGQYQPFTEDQRQWQHVNPETGEVTEVMHDEMLKKWNWQFTGFANTYKGYPKEWKLKPKAK